MTERQELGSLEAMLFAHAEPVEAARLADALRLDTEETTELLQKLQKLYDELSLIHIYSQREASIEGQLRDCKDYAEKNGITVVGTYIDRAYSAKTDDRPDFQRMIKDLSLIHI